MMLRFVVETAYSSPVFTSTKNILFAMSGPEFLLIAKKIPITPTSNPMTMIAI